MFQDESNWTFQAYGFRTKEIAKGRPKTGRSRKATPLRAPQRRIPLLLRFFFLLFIFSIPIEPINRTLQLGPISVARLAGLGLFPLSIFFFRRCFSVIPPPLWWFGGYVLAYAMLVLTIDPVFRPTWQSHVFTLVQLLVVFFIASNLMRDEKFGRSVVRIFAFATIGMMLATSLNLPGFGTVVMKGSGEERMSTMGSNPNFIGMILAASIVILLGLAIERKLRGLLLVAAAIPLLIMLVQTGSRAGIVGMTVGSCVYLVRANLSRKAMAIALLSCGLLGTGLLIVQDPTMVFRWTNTAQGDSAGRDVIVAHARSMISEKPLMGWGPAFTTELRIRHSGFDTGEGQDAHNIILNLLLDVGLLGTIPFIVGVALCCRAGWKVRDRLLGLTPLATIITFLVCLQFHGWVETKGLWFSFALCAAAANLPTTQMKARVRQPKVIP